MQDVLDFMAGALRLFAVVERSIQPWDDVIAPRSRNTLVAKCGTDRHEAAVLDRLTARRAAGPWNHDLGATRPYFEVAV
jgi:hypothetical protein